MCPDSSQFIPKILNANIKPLHNKWTTECSLLLSKVYQHFRNHHVFAQRQRQQTITIVNQSVESVDILHIFVGLKSNSWLSITKLNIQCTVQSKNERMLQTCCQVVSGRLKYGVLFSCNQHGLEYGYFPGLYNCRQKCKLLKILLNTFTCFFKWITNLFWSQLTKINNTQIFYVRAPNMSIHSRKKLVWLKDWLMHVLAITIAAISASSRCKNETCWPNRRRYKVMLGLRLHSAPVHCLPVSLAISCSNPWTRYPT